MCKFSYAISNTPATSRLAGVGGWDEILVRVLKVLYEELTMK